MNQNSKSSGPRTKFSVAQAGTNESQVFGDSLEYFHPDSFDGRMDWATLDSLLETSLMAALRASLRTQKQVLHEEPIWSIVECPRLGLLVSSFWRRVDIWPYAFVHFSAF